MIDIKTDKELISAADKIEAKLRQKRNSLKRMEWKMAKTDRRYVAREKQYQFDLALVHMVKFLDEESAIKLGQLVGDLQSYVSKQDPIFKECIDTSYKIYKEQQ